MGKSKSKKVGSKKAGLELHPEVKDLAKEERRLFQAEAAICTGGGKAPTGCSDLQRV